MSCSIRWFVMLVAMSSLATRAHAADPERPPPSRWAWLRDPRTAVLAVLGSVAVIGGGRKWVQYVRARRAVDRLSAPDVSPEEIAAAADHGREGIMELFRILGTADDARQREAAGHALAVLWARDQLIAEEEKAIVSRGYVVTWKARRRYPRGMSRPIPIVVEFGVPFLSDDGEGVAPGKLLWSYRIAGAERASLETLSAWQPGPCRVAFEVEPTDFDGNGPHRLTLEAKVRTTGLTSSWELNLPHIPFTFEFDPILAVDALLTLPDDRRGQAIAAAVRLGPLSSEGRDHDPAGNGSPIFLVLDDQFALRDPPEVVVSTPLPCDLAHEAAVEIEGIEGTFPAGAVVLSGQGTGGIDMTRRFALGPIQGIEPGRIGQPGTHRLRVVLTADPGHAWADPDARSVWPGTIITDWSTVRIVRR